MRIDAITIFPRMLEAALGEGIVQRAREAGLVDIRVHDLRAFTDDRHRSVDDAPFGGGPGMVMKPEPFARALESIGAARGEGTAVVLLSPRGRRFEQETARRYARLDRLALLCGRYEGIDERVAQELASEELSLGDFVLTGGETAALAVVEATVRLVPGALGDEGSAESDSFEGGVLDWPHYTRPASWRGHDAPPAPRAGGPPPPAAGPAVGGPRPHPPFPPQGGPAGDARAAPRPPRAGPALARGREAPSRDRGRGARGRPRGAGQKGRSTSQIGTVKGP